MKERDLFTEALARSPGAERAAFLDLACERDSALRARVERLLALHEVQDPLLDQSPVEALTYAGRMPPLAMVMRSASLETGLVIAGRYTLTEKLGEGGMGEVWAAQQTEPVHRLVAVKMIRNGDKSRAVVNRFEQERQALAVLDHPNIARVFDGGATSTGQPFFAMELVRGKKVNRYSDDHTLTLQQRLELFVPVCRAVQHAHQKGVIHRDLKPDNILVAEVDGRPVPKVIDFGVAKATGLWLHETSLDTLPGSIIGTLEYMAPEQADPGGCILDTRADIYSLGVILYELLVGLRPISAERLKSAPLLETVRILHQEEPARPSTRLSSDADGASLAALRRTDLKRLTSQLRGDLDWVVMRCLEKSPDRRYQTSEDLARDLERFLANQPVDARPPSAWYRVRKFTRRNRGPVVAAGLVLGTLVFGLAGTGWGLLVARQSAIAERAAKSEAVAEKEVADAVRDFLQTRLLGQANVLAQANALNASGRSATAARPDVTVRELLDRAAGDLTPEALSARFPEKPLVHAGLLQTVGEAYSGIGDFQRGIPFLRRAFALKTEHLGANSPQTLIVCQHLANACNNAGQWTEAIELAEDVIRRMTATLGPDDRETLNARNTLANTLLVAGRTKDSLNEYDSLLPQVLVALGPDDKTTLAVRTGMAQACRAAGLRDRAATLFQQAYDAAQATLGPDHPTTLLTMCDLALSYDEAGKTAIALPIFEEAKRRTAERLGADHPHSLIAAGNLAGAYGRQGKTELALKLAEDVSKQSVLSLGVNHPDTLKSRNNLAFAYAGVGQPKRAAEIFEDVLNRRNATLGPDHPDTLASLNNLAIAYGNLGQWKAARPLLEKASAARKAKLGVDHPNTLSSLASLAFVYTQTGPPELAVATAEEAVNRLTATLGPKHRDTLRAITYLVVAYEKAGRLVDSVPVQTALLASTREVYGPEHPTVTGELSVLGTLLLQLERFAEAEPVLRELLAARDKTIPREWRTANTRSQLGGALLGQKKYAEAEPLLLAGYDGLKNQKLPPSATIRPVEALNRLIALAEATNRPEMAKKWRDELANFPPPQPAKPPSQ